MTERVVLYRCVDLDCQCGLFFIEEERLQFGCEILAAGSKEAVEAAKRLMELKPAAVA